MYRLNSAKILNQKTAIIRCIQINLYETVKIQNLIKGEQMPPFIKFKKPVIHFI